jgi:MFS family permease
MIPAVVLIGLAMNANMSVALVLAQEYLPARMGLATGLMLGISGAAGGLIVAALGLLGDAAGPSSVLYVIAALPLAVAALASTLPLPTAAPRGRFGDFPSKAGTESFKPVPGRVEEAPGVPGWEDVSTETNAASCSAFGHWPTPRRPTRSCSMSAAASVRLKVAMSPPVAKAFVGTLT